MHLFQFFRKSVSLLLALVLVFGMAVLPAAALGESSETITVTGSKYVAKGKKITLSASEPVTWKSSNKKIATVSSKGVVKGIKAGKVTITATSKADKSVKKTWKVTVLKNGAKTVKIKAPSKTLDLSGKKTVTLKATVSPSSAAQSVTWKSSNTAVAKVSSKGKVTAVKAGTAKITATATDGTGKKASVTITVKPGKKTLTVGVSMPTDQLQRWAKDGITIESQLRSAGHKAILKYADNSTETQASQIESMIDSGCDVLVIAPVDGGSLGSVMKTAVEKGIKVIAYDRLILNSDGVSYYVTFSSYAVGKLQGNYIKSALGLGSAEGPFTLEITAGDLNDMNAGQFYNGAMSVLRPYIKSGKLTVPSGQTEFSEVSTQWWMPDNAQARAAELLSLYYADGSAPDAWLCSNDSTAIGVIRALRDAGAGSRPVITGQDCDYENVQAILNGEQSMSVFKRTADLAKLAASMVNAIAQGKVPDTSATTDNGTIQVPTAYAKPIAITVDNYSILVDEGWYN